MNAAECSLSSFNSIKIEGDYKKALKSKNRIDNVNSFYYEIFNAYLLQRG
jgi:hypothetical protein